MSKNFIVVSNVSYVWQVIGKFDKLKPALDCTARYWKKSNGQTKSRIIDKESNEVIYFKNKEILRRPCKKDDLKWI